MAHGTMIILKNCIHCKRAMLMIEKLKLEHPEYAEIIFDVIDETEHPEIAKQFSYYYVPSFFWQGEKLHEGAIKPEMLQDMYQRLLDKSRKPLGAESDNGTSKKGAE